MTINRTTRFLFTFFLALLQFAQCQVNIEVYDAKIFARKIAHRVYHPNDYPNEKPVIVNVSLYLDHFGPYDETKSEFSMALQVHFNWFDERLAANSSEISNSANFNTAAIQMLNIWRPSIYFSNPNMPSAGLLSEKSSGQIMGRIMASGRVHLVKRTTMTGSCKVNIKLYPVDVQQCSIQLESSINDNQLSLQWAKLPGSKDLVFSDDFKLGNFELIDHNLFGQRVSYQNVGPFSRLKVMFTLRRQLGYYLIEVYLPSALFVISSWTAFWVDIPAAPARVALVLTTMLSHVTSSKSVHDKTPRISYVHSLDIWNIVCTMFIFAAVVEYALVNYFFHKPDRVERKNKERTVPPNSPSTSKQSGELTGGDERRFSMCSAETQPNTSRSAKESPVGRLWNKALKLAVPPFEMVKPRRRALKIDRLSRIFFPLTFLLFNILYWSVLLHYSYRNNPLND